MVEIPIIHVLVPAIRAITRLRVETAMAQLTTRRAHQEVLLPARLRTAHRRTARLHGPVPITARRPEATRAQEANTAHRRGLTASRRTALLREVTAHHPVEEGAAVQAVLREVQDNPIVLAQR